MKRLPIAECAALALGIGFSPTLALAQSVEIPLSYALNTGHNYGFSLTNPVLILKINIGVNGGAAQPRSTPDRRSSSRQAGSSPRGTA